MVEDEEPVAPPETEQPVVNEPEQPAEQPNSSAAHAAASTVSKSKQKKKRAVDIDSLPGFDKLPSKKPNNGGGGGGDGDGGKRQGKKPVEAVVKLSRHMSGKNMGQIAGNPYYAISNEYEENEAFKKLARKILFEEAKWFREWSKHAVRCPTAQLATKMHNAVLNAPDLPETARRMNKTLDLSAYEHEKVIKPSVTLATSELQFETRRDGLLPPSIMVVGNVYPFKEFMKHKFPEGLRYLDLLFKGGTETKTAWVLEVASQTERTGTLADFLRSLGVAVTEVDLDEDEDEDDDAERDDDALVDDEAVEDNDEEEAEEMVEE